MHSYLTVEAIKPYLNDTTNRNDEQYRRALEGVSKQLDDWLDRTFQPYRATRYYTAETPDELIIDDILTVTSVKLDENGDRTYERTMSTVDYCPVPYNAPADARPYTALEIQPNRQYVFSTLRRAVEVTGVWGYWQDLVTPAVTLSTATGMSTASTSMTLSAVGVIEPGHTVLIESEQVYVTAVNGAVASVERAQNGTTVAAHSTATAIQIYRYPAPIVEACRIQATRLFKRKDAPFGSFAGPTDLTENVVEVSRLDPDVEQLIKHYGRQDWLAV